ncbi:plastocyanin [Hydrogenophaga sp. MI9]|uniref:plastocyanin n=1 Tax=Hydrogenophaga sp. MI9 TaxID=3453719 RepID=UPI003EEE34D7
MRPATLLAACLLAGLSAAQAATVQVTVLARDGKPLPDAVVILEPAAGQPVPASQPVSHTITQEKMQFEPALSLVPMGSRIRFANLDRWDHHVKGGAPGLLAAGTTAFEFRLAGRTQGQPTPSNEVLLDKTGPIQLGCHLHGSMRGFVYVSPTPWAAKTSADGVAVMPQVPEGAMQLRVWHADQLVDQANVAVQVQPVTSVSVPTLIQPRKPRRVQFDSGNQY